MGKVGAPISEVPPYDRFFWIFLYYGKLIGKPIHFPFDEVNLTIGITQGKSPILGKTMTTNLPGSPHTMDFFTFSRTMKNWLRNPCIFHMLKYTIGWELDGKGAPILWEKYEYQFPRIFPSHRFCYIFPYCGKFLGKTTYFPYDDIV